MKGLPRRRLLSLVLAVWLGSLATGARAASIDDPALAKGPLDLRRLVATKHDATAPLHLKIVTYGSWPARLLDVASGNRLFFLFNSDRVGREDFTGEIFFRDGRLRMRITDANGDVVQRVRVDHPTADSVTATVPRGLPNPDGNAWLAAAETYRTATGYCARTCYDRIPSGSGWLKLTPGQ